MRNGKGEGRWQLIGSRRNYLTTVWETKVNRTIIKKKNGGTVSNLTVLVSSTEVALILFKIQGSCREERYPGR